MVGLAIVQILVGHPQSVVPVQQILHLREVLTRALHELDDVQEELLVLFVLEDCARV